MSLFSRCAVWVGAVWVRRVFKSLVGAVLAALLYHALLAWVLPAVVHSQLPTWLHNKTGHTLRMGKPHINPWTWSVTVPKLQLDTPQGQTLVAFNQLQVDIAPKALLTGTLALHTVDCQGLAVHTGLLPNGQFNWAPLIQALQPAHPEPEGPPPAFSLGRLVLQQATLSFADERTPQGFRTQLDPINLQLQHVSTRSTTAGQLELHARTSFNAEVHIQAQVSLQQPSVQGRIQIQGANLALLAQALEGIWPGPTPTGTAGLQADVALSLPKGKPQVLVDQLDINGQELALQAPTGQTHLALGFKQVKLNASAINSATLDQPIPLQVHIEMQSGGQVEAQAQYTPSTQALQADIKVDQLHLAWLQPFIGQAVRLELASGIATGQAHIALANDWQIAGQLAIKQLRLNHAGSTQAALVLNTINTPKFELTPKGLQVGELNVSGLKTALLIAKNKTTNFSNLQTQPPQKAEAQTAPFGVRIQQINLSNSALDFADESLLTPFGTHIHHLNGRLNNVNMPANGHTRLTLTGEVDEFGWAQAQGELNLFDPLRFLNLGVKFENLALNSLTPYSATFANRKIEAGKLNLNLAYRVENQQLNSTNQVRIQNLVLGDRVNSPQATDLPLDLAIALLQDSQGRIQLDLPISGSLNNPEFSYGAIVWKAIGNVLTKAVSAPFRALAGLFGHEDPLEPPQFQPGADTLLPPQRERLLLLAQALEKRPNLVLTIQTGWAPADQEALAQPPSPAPKPTPEQLQQQLTHLAEKRQALVLEGLQAAGLAPNRVQMAPLGPLPPAADAAWVPVELKLTHQRP